MEYGSFQAEEFGDLQRLVDGLFYDRHAIDRLDLIVQAEILDLAPDLMEIVNLLPPSTLHANSRASPHSCQSLAASRASSRSRRSTLSSWGIAFPSIRHLHYSNDEF